MTGGSGGTAGSDRSVHVFKRTLKLQKYMSAEKKQQPSNSFRRSPQTHYVFTKYGFFFFFFQGRTRVGNGAELLQRGMRRGGPAWAGASAQPDLLTHQTTSSTVTEPSVCKETTEAPASSHAPELMISLWQPFGVQHGVRIHTFEFMKVTRDCRSRRSRAPSGAARLQAQQHTSYRSCCEGAGTARASNPGKTP